MRLSNSVEPGERSKEMKTGAVVTQEMKTADKEEAEKSHKEAVLKKGLSD